MSQSSDQSNASQSINSSSIHYLSSDVLSLALLYLSPFELTSAAAVCRRWLNLTVNQSVNKPSVLWRQCATNCLVKNKYMKQTKALVNIAQSLNHPNTQSNSQSDSQSSTQSTTQSSNDQSNGQRNGQPSDLTVPALLYMTPRWPRGFDSVPMISISGHEHEMIVERDWPAEEVYQDYERVMKAVNDETLNQSPAVEIDEDMKLRDAFPTGIHNQPDNRTDVTLDADGNLNTPTVRFYAALREFLERERKSDEDEARAANPTVAAPVNLSTWRLGDGTSPPVDQPIDAANRLEQDLPRSDDAPMEENDQSIDDQVGQSEPSNQTHSADNVDDADHDEEDDEEDGDERPVGWSLRGPQRAMSITSDTERTAVSVDDTKDDGDVDHEGGDEDMHDNEDEEGGWEFEVEDEDPDFDSEGFDSEGMEGDEFDQDEEEEDEEDVDDDAQIPDPAILYQQALQARGSRPRALDALQQLLRQFDAAMTAQKALLAARRLQQDRLRQSSMRLGSLMLSDDESKQKDLHQGARQRRREERWLSQSKIRSALRLSDTEDEEAQSDDEEKQGEHMTEPVSRVRYAYTRRNRDRAIVLDEPFPLRNPQMPTPFTVLEWMSVAKFQQLQAQANESNSLSASQILPASQAPARPAHLSHDYVPVLRISLVAYFEINIENEDVEEVNRLERSYFEAVAQRRRDARIRRMQEADENDEEYDAGDAAELDAEGNVPAGYDVVQVAQHRFAARSQCIALGICNQQFPLFGKQPGWDRHSYGYHGDDGNCFYASGSGTKFGPSYGAGDTVGLALNYIDGSISFTRNGRFVGVHPASRTRPLEGEWYGCVGIDSRRTIRANIHGPFVFDTSHFDMAIQRTGAPPLDFVACKRFFQAALRARRQAIQRAKAARAKANRLRQTVSANDSQ